MNVKRIYTKSMTEYLVDHGCNLLRIVPDVADPKKKVWLFEDNDLLQLKMSEFTFKKAR